ncbi:MAG: hypothetical protein JNJ80_26085 [Gemmatimonadetes bacterium]|nr:hypothetical protein [Gemmatimonadota bacterium]
MRHYLLLPAALAAAGCLSDKVVQPTEPLPAVISLDKPGIQFVRFALGRQVAADTIAVGNNGEAPLGTVSVDPTVLWVTSQRTGWLSTSVINDGTGARVILRPTYVDTAGAPPDTARILIRATGAAQSRFVSVVARTLPGARFEFSTNPVTFATVPGGPPSLTQTYSVRNGGNGDLPIPTPRIRYEGTAANWLTATRVAGGSATAPSFDLVAAPRPLPSGLHQAWVIYESPATDPVRAPTDSFPAQLRIGSPRLGISSAVVSFVTVRGGVQTVPQVATLANVGEGTFASVGAIRVDPPVYQAGGSGWLTADLADGVVTLTALPGTLPAGTYGATVPIVSEFGGSIDLAATLEVRLPGLALSSRTVSFNATAGGQSPAPRSVQVGNSGSGTLATLGTLSVGGVTYGRNEPVGWLAASLIDSTVTLTPTLGSLLAGIYTATVSVTSQNGGGDAITATFSVARASDPPALTVSTTAIGLSGVRGDPDPARQTVLVANAGGGSLGTIGIGAVTAGWITASVVGGNVEIGATVGSLAAGTHTGTVQITSQNGGNATVTVSLTVGLPVLTLSATTAAFNATQGTAAAPASRVITASNSGAGSLTTLGTLTRGAIAYGAGQPTGWLTATLAGAALTLSAATGALPPGVYVATVPITSPSAGTRTVTVTFSVATPAAQPDLALATASLSFFAVEGGASPASQSVGFYNSGGGLASDLGSISATIPGTASWLGRSIGGSAVTFTATTGSLAAGVYSTSVPIVSTGGGTETVTISFTVAPAATPPRLALSSTSVSLATTEGAATTLAPRTLTVSNAGGGSLGTISLGAPSYAGTHAGWLAQPTVSGSTITITPSTAGLPAGTSTATFQVSTSPAVSGSPITVTVGLTVADTADATAATPRLTLASTQISFATDSGGTTPSNQTIDVSNTGNGSLGTVSLGATTYGGTSTGWLTTKSYNAGTDRITLGVTTASLPPGVSTASFAVNTSNAATGSPATVTVRLTIEPVAPAPQLALSTNTLSFAAQEGSNPAGSQTISLSNAGGGTLGAASVGAISYGAGASGWLTRTLAGSVVTVSAATASLAPGTYSATFGVTASGTTETVTVRATVAPAPTPPVLTLSSLAEAFSTQAGTSPAAQTVTVTNTGGGDLASLGTLSLGTVGYGAGQPTGWLTAGIVGATGVVTLTPSTAALAAGSYTATVPVNSTAGGSATIQISLTVAANNAAPALAVSVTAVTFQVALGGSAPAPQTVTITNTGGGTLSGLAAGPITFPTGQATSWLVTPVAGALGGSSVTFAVDPTGLLAGVYTASVPITSTNGGSRTIGVTMTVEAPILTLSTRSVSFGTTQGTTAPPDQTVTISNTGIGSLGNLGTVSLGAVSYGSGEPVGWLAASFDGVSTITLGATIVGMPQGTFTARVPVQSQNGGNAILVVTYTVAPGAAPPVLSLSADLVAFSGTVGGSNPAPQTVTVGNAGGQTLGTVSVGLVTPTSDWLDVTLSGSQLQFAVDISGLAPGAYAARVPVISTTAGTKNIAVTLTVGAPRIALSVTSVTFGDTVASTRTLAADVFISNGGAGDLASLGALRIGTVRYHDGEPTGWLLAPAANTALTTPIVGLRGQVLGLAAGQYHADVEVTSARGGADTIAVTLAVNQPDPSFDRPSIAFFQNGAIIDTAFVVVRAGDTTQTAVRVDVGNPTNTALALTGLRVGTPTYPSGATGWIPGAFLDKTSAPFGSPAELLVAINPRGLPTGRHRAEIEISSTAAKNSPKKLFVVVTVQ